MASSISLDDDDTISAINVTPLVDVVLVLLIIFMITAPAIYQTALQVRLPKAGTGETAPKTPLNFAITRTGDLSLNRDPLPWDQLPQRLNALGSSAAEQTAIISADSDTIHGNVVRLMDALRKAGLTRFALNVDRDGKQ